MYTEEKPEIKIGNYLCIDGKLFREITSIKFEINSDTKEWWGVVELKDGSRTIKLAVKTLESLLAENRAYTVESKLIADEIQNRHSSTPYGDVKQFASSIKSGHFEKVLSYHLKSKRKKRKS